MDRPAVDIRELHKSFGAVHAVRGLSLTVREGECFGLLGPNGAGKTTTIEICEGLVAGDRGSVTVLGRSWAHDARALRERIGIALQETQLSDKLTVEETLRLFRSFYQAGRPVGETIEAVELGEKRRARVGTLSGGQRQRLAVACALVGDPELLFLDEPTTGLDPQSRRGLWELVERFRATGRTVVLTTHYMEEAERLCDRVAIVDHGQVIALDTPRALIEQTGADQVVHFAAAGGGALTAERLGAIPGVLAARRAGEGYELQVAAAHAVIPALLAEVEHHGATLTELRTHSPTLEDVFVALTGRELRDE